MTIRISFSDKTVRVAVEINGAIESAITELPQRKWVGLTDAEVDEIYEQAETLVHDSWVGTVGLMFPITLYKMFEAKLKEENT
jgi:hypothetical protein